MMVPGRDLQHLMEQYTLSRRFARRFPRVQLRVAYPGSDHRTWNGMEKKKGADVSRLQCKVCLSTRATSSLDQFYHFSLRSHGDSLWAETSSKLAPSTSWF